MANIESTRMDLTVENFASVSTAVLVGSFDGYDEPMWNTVDGKRPAKPSIHGSELIYRPAQISATRVLRGDPNATSVIARVEGGAIGCDSYSFDYTPVLKPGSDYLFFLSFSVSAAGLYTIDPMVIEAWPIDSKGVVMTATEGSVPLDTIAAAVDRSTAPTLPTE